MTGEVLTMATRIKDLIDSETSGTSTRPVNQLTCNLLGSIYTLLKFSISVHQLP